MPLSKSRCTARAGALMQTLESRVMLSTSLLTLPPNSTIDGAVTINGTLYLQTTDTQIRLWATDGSLADLREISAPGLGTSKGPVELNHQLVWSVTNNGKTTWRLSDGAASGAPAATDETRTLPADITINQPVQMGASNFFITADSLVKIGSTFASTTVLKTLPTANRGSLLQIGQRLVWISGETLWTGDGTDGGTVALKTTGLSGSLVSELAVAGSVAYFPATDSSKGTELWRTDGTAAGTFRVGDLRHGSASSNPNLLGAIGNKMLFGADDDQGTGLWISDGSTAGTQRLRTLTTHDIGFSPHPSASINGHVMFWADDGSGPEIWTSDGTNAGTRPLLHSDQQSPTHTDALLRLSPGSTRAIILSNDNPVRAWSSDGITAKLLEQYDNSAGESVQTAETSFALNGAVYVFTPGQSRPVRRISDDTISISGTAFNDVDADVAEDFTEPALKNIRIYFDTNNDRKFESGEPSQITDSRGRYAFYNLSPGNYHIRAEALANTWTTSAGFALTLAAGDHVVERLGLHLGTGLMTGYVQHGGGGVANIQTWVDLNRNGRLENGEPRTLTDQTGYYTLGGLPAGTYFVRSLPRAGWIASNIGGTKGVILANTAARIGRIFHDITVKLTGTVFEDVNQNGKRDSAEINVRNASISVFQDLNGDATFENGEPTTTIDTGGTFTMQVLPNELNSLRVITRAGWRPRKPEDLIITNPDGSETATVPATQLAGLSGRAFADLNKNAIYDAKDFPFRGYAIYADANHNGKLDTGEQSAVVDASGFWNLDVPAGTYDVRIDYTNAHFSTPSVYSITVTKGQEKSKLNFGLYPL